MNLHFSLLIKHCSREVILSELEADLRSEAWEIWRVEDGLVASGIGTSTRVVNLADRTSFSISSFEDSVVVDVRVEFQAVRSLSADSQALRVRQRHEAIIAYVCDRLRLQWDQYKLPRVEIEPQSSEPDPSIRRDPAPLQREAEETFISHASSTSSDFTLGTPFRPPAQSTDSAPISGKISLLNRALVTVSMLSLLIVMIFFSIRQWKYLSRLSVHQPASKSASEPSAVNSSNSSRLPRSLDPPPRNMTDETYKKGSAADLRNPSTPALQHPDDVKLWVADWAASERTKDAGIQTAFYADRISPYLSHESYDKATLYQDKQAAIRNRKGLWTFAVEDVSIRRRNENVVLVNLTKHYMTQAGTVEVSEQWIPSSLVLVRTNGRWTIAAERDLRSRTR
jgi:hypothetical protein